ncbi:capsular biosynthesis protein [Synechococcus sp. M16CYN]
MPVLVQVRIDGPVLLLMGPIGLFFARLSRYLRKCGVPVTKVAFPLREFGFPSNLKVAFRGDMKEWRPFVRRLIQDRGIRHIFMYGDFIIPHRVAIEEAQTLGIEAWVFELGYLRPNYVTLERDRVNARSNLNKPASFYRNLAPVDQLPQGIVLDPGWRWRKAWKAPTFIQHAFTDYPIIEREHKLQPSPSFLWCQMRGIWRYWLYRWKERGLKRRLLEHVSFFLAVLQVSSDSQIQTGSPYRGMHDFIEDVIHSFAKHAHVSDQLTFKHHPRDRGYNNYEVLIGLLARRYAVADRVHYFHDGPLSTYLRVCRGVVTVNSTVGLQALFHAVPTKTMGSAFYDLEGLTDQKSLDDFWRNPYLSDRSLFYRFYNHLITSTQVNGNFDGDFPFRTTFPVGLEARQLDPIPTLPELKSRPIRSLLTPITRTLSRLAWAVLGFVLYSLQLPAVLLGRRDWAAQLMTLASAVALRALGIQVVVDDSQRSEQPGIPLVHIFNHRSPCDGLVIQSILRMPGLTTAQLHLRWVLPGYAAAARNAGSAVLDHRQPQSRLAGLMSASKLLKDCGEIMIAPNGSLVTPIEERASPSAWMLAQYHGGCVVPWVFHYESLDDAVGAFYKPLQLLLRRLTAPPGIIHCRCGRSSDLKLPQNPKDRDGFSRVVQQYYRERLGLN